MNTAPFLVSPWSGNTSAPAGPASISMIASSVSFRPEANSRGHVRATLLVPYKTRRCLWLREERLGFLPLRPLLPYTAACVAGVPNTGLAIATLSLSTADRPCRGSTSAFSSSITRSLLTINTGPAAARPKYFPSGELMRRAVLAGCLRRGSNGSSRPSGLQPARVHDLVLFPNRSHRGRARSSGSHSPSERFLRRLDVVLFARTVMPVSFSNSCRIGSEHSLSSATLDDDSCDADDEVDRALPPRQRHPTSSTKMSES